MQELRGQTGRYKAAWRSGSAEGAAEVSPVRKRRVFSEKEQGAP